MKTLTSYDKKDPISNETYIITFLAKISDRLERIAVALEKQNQSK